MNGHGNNALELYIAGKLFDLLTDVVIVVIVVD